MVSGVALEVAHGLFTPLIDSSILAWGDVNVGGTVELDVVVIDLLAILIREHVVDVLVVVDNESRHLKVLEDVRHDLGEVELRSMLESWQIDENCLALAGIAQQVEEALALRLIDGIIGAEEDDVLLIDAWPNHVETVGWILTIVDNGIVFTILLEDGGKRCGAVGVAVNGLGVDMVLLKKGVISTAFSSPRRFSTCSVMPSKIPSASTGWFGSSK